MKCALLLIVHSSLIYIPGFYHSGWHTLFGNLTPEEAIDFIERVFMGKGSVKKKKRWKTLDLYNLQLKIQSHTMQKRRLKEKNK